MVAAKFIMATVLFVGVSASIPLRAIHYDHYQDYEDPDYDDRYPEVYEEVRHPYPGLFSRDRVRRQAQGSLSVNSDGEIGLGGKVPLVGNDKNILSAIGRVDLNDQLRPASKGIGLALDNVNGHGLSVMKESVPGFGSKLTGAGHATLFNDNVHDVGANAFVTKNMPTNFPGVPNFNTVGGGIDYMYKNKIGASLGMAQTPFLDRKDYSAMGNLNLFRSPTSTVDFSAGFKRFDTPVMNSGWKPNFMLNFGRTFP